LNHSTHAMTELQFLQEICDPSTSAEKRLALLREIERRTFAEPEHQVVLESVRALVPSGRLSPGRLALHLNNRGFPDIDMNLYFRAAEEVPSLGTQGAEPKKEGA
jgi:hypothetical protein